MASTARAVKADIKRRAKPKRARRTRDIDRRSWRSSRLKHFEHNVDYAAAAKSTRLALDVTQQEVAEYFGVAAPTVSTWESGSYCWKGEADELAEYQQACNVIHRRRRIRVA